MHAHTQDIWWKYSPEIGIGLHMCAHTLNIFIFALSTSVLFFLWPTYETGLKSHFNQYTAAVSG